MGTSIRLPPTQKWPKTEKIEIFKKMKKKFLGGSVFDADYRGEVHFAQFRFLKKNFFFLEKFGSKKNFLLRVRICVGVGLFCAEFFSDHFGGTYAKIHPRTYANFS